MAHGFGPLDLGLCRASSWQSGRFEAIGPRVKQAKQSGTRARAYFSATLAAAALAAPSLAAPSLAGAALAGAALGCASPKMLPLGAPNALVGRELPEFRKQSLRGEVLHSARFRGRPLVIKFFAEYCEPCKRTLPATERLRRELPSVAFVGVSEDDHARTAERAVAAYSLSFPVVHDAGKELLARLRIRALPATVVIDRDGFVRWVGGPDQTEHDVAEAIRMIAE